MELKNCRLIPELSDGVNFALADITVMDGQIAAVRPATGTPPTAEDIDCQGKTVLPGLFDLHVHLVGDAKPNTIYNAFALFQQYAPQMNNFLDYGVTTVRDCGSTMRLACYLRDAVDSGMIPGPRILSSGHIISPEAMRNSGENGIHTIANGRDEVIIAARKEFAAGADFIKIYATQSMSQVRGQDPKIIFSPEEITAMVAVAESCNSYVAAHAHSTDAINTCIKYGVRSIEHATYMDDESIRLLLGTPGAYAVLTHACGEPYHGQDGYNNPDDMVFWTRPYMVESKKRCRALESKAYRAGVKIGFGTDLMPGDFVKYSYEMQIRRESCGMGNIDILRQATQISAEIAMLGGVTGTVREGYCADLIAVDGNPDEDISVMYGKPSLVMKAGSVVRRAAGK